MYLSLKTWQWTVGEQFRSALRELDNENCISAKDVISEDFSWYDITYPSTSGTCLSISLAWSKYASASQCPSTRAVEIDSYTKWILIKFCARWLKREYVYGMEKVERCQVGVSVILTNMWISMQFPGLIILFFWKV